MQRILRFVNRTFHREPRLPDDQLVQLAEEIVGYGRTISLLLLPDPATQARSVGVDVGELAFRLRETTGTVTAALLLLEKEGRASRTWLDGHWILLLKSEDMRNAASQGHKDRRTA